VEPAAGEADFRRVRHLVSVSEGDPLAPFALRPEKLYAFSPDGRAAIGYRIRLGCAVASGDPVGAVDAWPEAIDEFVRFARSRKLRVAVLGAGERAKPLWARYHFACVVPIGRDVVVHRNKFTLEGRRYRNLRQAIQRARNAGVTVEVRREGDLTAAEVEELRSLLKRSRRIDTRGFSMILGRLFDGATPDAVVAVARDASGRAVAMHRYLWAGKDLTLDLPIRAPGAPNGVDERLIAELVRWGEGDGVERISLAFAPFPDLFDDPHSLGLLGKFAYHAVHLLDPLISVERLYRYLRKFHAFDQERYVILRWRHIPVVALAALLLEFG
jgi:lysylphosphatidylglycerol synthetase-like protein (DUF2156 family)